MLGTKIKYIVLNILILPLYATVDYSSEIQPIFNSNCTNCHHIGSASYSNHELDLTSYSGLMLGGESGVVVIPGNSNSSILYDQIFDGNMPPGGIDLPDFLVELIAQWIDEGALFEPLLLGDINGDGFIDVLDIVLVVNLVLASDYEINGDMNADGSLDVLDIVQLVNIIIN